MTIKVSHRFGAHKNMSHNVCVTENKIFKFHWTKLILLKQLH